MTVTDLAVSLGGIDTKGFSVITGDAGSPVILHVPHASTTIPEPVRAGILLNDEELAAELAAMTDAHTDQLAGLAAARSRPGPWRFVNRWSRLVIDPERFPDDREELNKKGMGAVYIRTSQGKPLRHHPDQTLIRDYFAPYAAGLTAVVDDRLEMAGRAVILDIHSYPVEALPYELHQGAARPEVCLGIDPLHTPAALLDAARSAFDGFDVAVDAPFTGTYVPLKHYGRDLRVMSIMIELRRDVVVDRFAGVADRIAELVSKA